MTWWMLVVLVLAPLAAFAFAWSLGKVGDYALAHPRKSLRNSLMISGAMAVLFVVQALSHWREGSQGLGFWIAVGGTVMAAINLGLGLRELRRS